MVVKGVVGVVPDGVEDGLRSSIRVQQDDTRPLAPFGSFLPVGRCAAERPQSSAQRDADVVARRRKAVVVIRGDGRSAAEVSDRSALSPDAEIVDNVADVGDRGPFKCSDALAPIAPGESRRVPCRKGANEIDDLVERQRPVEGTRGTGLRKYAGPSRSRDSMVSRAQSVVLAGH
jgi:hypothetical protein